MKMKDRDRAEIYRLLLEDVNRVAGRIKTPLAIERAFQKFLDGLNFCIDDPDLQDELIEAYEGILTGHPWSRRV